MVKEMVEDNGQIRILDPTEPKRERLPKDRFQIDPQVHFICPFSLEAKNYTKIRLCRLTEDPNGPIPRSGVGCAKRLCENSGHEQCDRYRRNKWRLSDEGQY